MRWQRGVLAGSIALIAVSMVAAVIAIGQLGASVERALARTEEALELAKQISADTADLTDEFRATLIPVSDGVGSTADALVATRDVSAAVRDLLSSIRFIDNVQELRERLEAAEASLSSVESDLASARGSLMSSVVTLNSLVASMREVPAELDASIAELRRNRDNVDQQILLWRLAIVAGGLAVIGAIVVVGAIVTKEPERAEPAPASGPGSHDG